MLRSYLHLAVRTLRRRNAFTLVNAVRLTVGLACCAFVAVFLQYELSYDSHHAEVVPSRSDDQLRVPQQPGLHPDRGWSGRC